MRTKKTRLRAAHWLIPAVMLLLLMPGVARADFTLWDWSTRFDTNTYDLITPYAPPPGATLPPGINASAFDFTTGRGSLTFTFTTAGAHSGGVYFYNFFDHGNGIDQSSDYGAVGGTLPTGVSYQMDWPGFLNPGAPPTVFDNFAAGTLTDTNGVGASSLPPAACCSVAMALIDSFILAAGETGILTFQVSGSAPTAGSFYLQETDSVRGGSLYLTQNLTISGGGVNPVPEPSTIWMLVTVCGGFLYGMRKKITGKE